MRRISFLAVAVAVALTTISFVQFGGFAPLIVSAQSAVPPASFPTYDYDTATDGTQPPTSPLLANPTARQLQTFRLIVPVTVNVAALQAIMPAGFNATENPVGSGLAFVALIFDFQGRCEQLGVGTSGPGSGLFVFHSAFNTALNRPEGLLLAIEFSDESQVNCFNAVFGPGSSRVANVETEIREKRGQLQMKFDVRDPEIGLRVQVQADGPAAIVDRGRADPAGPLRSVNGGISASSAFTAGQQFDFLLVPRTPDNLTLKVGYRHQRWDDRGNGDNGDDEKVDRNGRGRLRLPGGSLQIMGVGAAFNFQRNFENFFAPE